MFVARLKHQRQPRYGNWQAGPIQVVVSNACSSVISSNAVLTVAPNQPPVVTLTNPATNSVFTVASHITMIASATDPDGTVSTVSFFAGTNLLGTRTSLPFQFDWINPLPGEYSFTAQVINNFGLAATSSPVTILVNALLLNVSSTGSGQVQLSFATVAGVSYTVEASSNLVHWASLITLTDTNGLYLLIDDATNFTRRFYRVTLP